MLPAEIKMTGKRLSHQEYKSWEDFIMKKKTVMALLTISSSLFIILIITGFYVLHSVFGITLFGSRENMVSKQEAKRQIAAYLNEKYSTDLFSARHISVKKAMIGCGCDSDPLEFVGYTAHIKKISNAPVSPGTVWMMIPEQADLFFTDDGQLEEVHRALELYLETNRISSDFLLLPSEHGIGFDYHGQFGTQWTPGKGFHAYFDGQNLSAFFDQEHEARSSFSGREASTYQYSVYFSVPGSEPEISQQEFYEDMEALKNSFHLSLDAVLMKESCFQQLISNAALKENSSSYPRGFSLSPAVYFTAYQDGECYSPDFLTLMPGISLALNQETKTPLTADNFHLEKTKTPEMIKAFFAKGSDGKIPTAALVNMLQTYSITCKTAEQSFEYVTLLIDLDALHFTYDDAGILQAENAPSHISTEYYSDSLLFANKAHTKFQLGSTLVMSAVLFPGNENMTLTICPGQYLEEGTRLLEIVGV